MPHSSLKELEQQLGESENFLHVLLQALPDAVFLSDLQGHIRYISPRGLSMFAAQTPEDIVGRNILHLIAPQELATAEKRFARVIRGEAVGLREYLFLRNDGSTFHLELNSTLLPGKNEDSSRIMFVGRDISDRKKIETELQLAHERLQYQATRDPLTDLFNRRYLEETLERELTRCLREELPLSVILMDLDFFKTINDTHGHKAGDIMLQAMARLLQASTRGEDIACRYGGEEFVVILPSAAPMHGIARAESWRRTFEALRLPYENHVLRATVSCGIATFPLHGTDSDALLRAADQALYEAKAEGRNRVKPASQPY
jgi:diguanylate cyclase (GGDEF)-like protein/PAS domain S-box-containing protein